MTASSTRASPLKIGRQTHMSNIIIEPINTFSETIDFRRLRCFLVLADELHFGRAAARLHMTQPPLSVAMRSLEDELGVVLLKRTTRSVRLTPAGELLRERGQAVLQDLERTSHLLKQLGAGMAGGAHRSPPIRRRSGWPRRAGRP